MRWTHGYADEGTVTMVRIATAAYPLDQLATWLHYVEKTRNWVSDAKKQGAELLVFPEYGALELATVTGCAADLLSLKEGCAAFEADLVALFEEHAVTAGVHILAPSIPAWRKGEIVNRAHFFGPCGHLGYQDKQIMTRFEREEWDVKNGQGLRLFETPIGIIGILICYDSEFPLLGRALVEAGAQIILTPSCTDGLAGYHRVRTGASARALEGQCVVVHSPTVGGASWSAAAGVNVGAAAVYGPPDKGFPNDGVLAIGELNRPGWVYADVDLALIDAVRLDGQVLNCKHWPEQEKADLRVEHIGGEPR